MPITLPNRFQYDPTGHSPDNLIVEEPHNVPQHGARIIVAREGVFYTHELTLALASGGGPLVPGSDYHFVSLDHYITAETGIETGTAIEIDAPLLWGDMVLTYHAVGGLEGRSNALIEDLLAAIAASANAGVDWQSIVNIPAQFPPAAHQHDITGLSELEVLTQVIDRLTEALMDSRPLVGSALSLRYQDERILELLAVLTRRVNELYARMEQYIRDEVYRATSLIHQIRWAQSAPADLGIYHGDTYVSRRLEAHTELGDVNLTWVLIEGALPGWMALDGHTGVISGLAPDISAPETYTFKVRVDDGFNAIAREFYFELLTGVDSINWITGENLSAVRGAVSLQLEAEDTLIAPIEYTLVGGSLPIGFTMDVNGLITGTASDAPATYVFTVEARSANDHQTRDFRMYFIDQPLTIGWDAMAAAVLPDINENTELVPPGTLPTVVSDVFLPGNTIDGQVIGQMVDPNTSPYTVIMDVLDLTIIGNAYGTLGNEIVNVTAHSLLGDNLIVYSIVAGALPPGLVLEADGHITGHTVQMTDTVTYNFTVSATDGNDVIQRAYTLDVVAENDSIFFTAPSYLGTLLGDVSIDVSATDPEGQPVTHSVTVGALPPGLSLSVDGLITGTITNIGQMNDIPYMFTIEATDGVNTKDRLFRIVVPNGNREPMFIANANLGVLVGNIAVDVSATDPEGGAVVHTITSGSLPPGISLTSQGVLVGVIDNTGYVMDVVFSFRVSATDGVFIVTKDFVIVVPAYNQAPVFSVDGNLGALVGNVNLDIAAIDPDGDTVTHSVSFGSLPPGVVLTAGGVLVGTISTAGLVTSSVYNFIVSATDGISTTTKPFSIVVPVDDTAPVFTAPSNLERLLGVVDVDVSATDPEGQPVVHSLIIGSLPPGVSLTPQGHVVGTIDNTGLVNDVVYNFTVSATDGVYVVNKGFTFTVPSHNDAPVYTGVASDLGNVSGVVSIDIAASDPDLDVLTHTVVSGAMPPGMVLSAAGVLSGDISADNQVYTFTVSASDGLATAERTFTLTASYGPIFTPGTVIDATVGGQPVVPAPGDTVIVDTVDLQVIT